MYKLRYQFIDLYLLSVIANYINNCLFIHLIFTLILCIQFFSSFCITYICICDILREHVKQLKNIVFDHRLQSCLMSMYMTHPIRLCVIKNLKILYLTIDYRVVYVYDPSHQAVCYQKLKNIVFDLRLQSCLCI